MEHNECDFLDCWKVQNCLKKLAMTEKYQWVPFNTHGAHIAYLTPSPVLCNGSDDLFKLREGKLIKDLLPWNNGADCRPFWSRQPQCLALKNSWTMNGPKSFLKDQCCFWSPSPTSYFILIIIKRLFIFPLFPNSLLSVCINGFAVSRGQSLIKK